MPLDLFKTQTKKETAVLSEALLQLGKSVCALVGLIIFTEPWCMFPHTQLQPG